LISVRCRRSGALRESAKLLDRLGGVWSGDLLLVLASREPAASLLASHGAPMELLASSHQQLREVLASESADWRLRLSARGGDEGDLALLLAICRSADSHAYQVLEHGGVRCAQLRRDIIERMRADGEARLRAAPMVAEAHPPRLRPRRASTLTSPRASVVRTTPTRRQVAEPEPREAPEEVDESASEARREPIPAPAEAAPATVSKPRRPEPLDPAALPPIFGRALELERLADALGRQRIRAPLLVGPCGSGRSALAMHLATVLSQPVFRLVATTYVDNEDLERDLRWVAQHHGVAILD